MPSVVSHASAAVLHRLPLWRVPLPEVHVIRQPPAAGSGSGRVHLHIALLPDDEVALIDGLAVTDVVRTVVRCRSSPRCAWPTPRRGEGPARRNLCADV